MHMKDKTKPIPGIATAISSDKNELTTHSEGIIANVSNPKKVTETTVFEAASLSKPVFAYIVLKLAQREILDLDKPLYTYFPKDDGFGPPDMRENENYKKLTARMILSHQAGLPNEVPPGTSLDYISPVGTRFDYSGVAYQFLGEVVEKLTSKSLETLAQEAFANLGMTRSSFMPPTACCFIKLSDNAPKPTPETIHLILEGATDLHNQLSIIYHQDKLYVAKKTKDGQLQIVEKDSNQVSERSLEAMKKQFYEIPNNSFWLSKPLPVEARELTLLTEIVGHPPEHAETIAIGHDAEGEVNPNKRFYIVHPGGSLYTTASDYAKFLNACTTDPAIRKELFKPALSSLSGKDSKAMLKGVKPEVLEKLSWGPGVGLLTNADGHLIAFHWGDNGSGRNLAAMNLTTGKNIVCLTNSANGSRAFWKHAEPVVGELSSLRQWLSQREGLHSRYKTTPARREKTSLF